MISPGLQLAQLDAADLAGDGLRQIEELDSAHALEWSEPLAREAQHRERHLSAWNHTRAQQQECLGYAQALIVGARHHRGFDDVGVLDQHALELERADAIVRGLEDIVGAPDEREVTI